MAIDDHDLGSLPDPITPGDSDTNAATSFLLARLQAWTGAVWKRLTLGQTTKAGSLPVTLASDSDPLPAGTNVIGKVINEPIASAADGLSHYTSAALEASKAAQKSGAGMLYSVLIYNSNTSTRWVSFYDNTTATGTVIHVEQVPGRNAGSGALGYASTPWSFGRPFAIGLSWATSSTAPATFTNAAASELWFEVGYK